MATVITENLTGAMQCVHAIF